MTAPIDSTGSAETQRLRDDLAAVTAERDRLARDLENKSGVWVPQEALAQRTAERDRLANQLAEHTQPYHSCSVHCQRPLCMLRRERDILRVAFGVEPGERVPLEQTPTFGSVLVESAAGRRRIAPVDDEALAALDGLRRLLPDHADSVSLPDLRAALEAADAVLKKP